MVWEAWMRRPGSGVDGMIEIDPGRLFWTSLAGTPAPSEQTFYFSIDQMLVPLACRA